MLDESSSLEIKLNTVHLIKKSIHNHVQRYQKNASKNGEYYLPSKTASTLQDEVLATQSEHLMNFKIL